MRLALAWIVLALLLPVALADQTVSQGPATVKTVNYVWGDGSCEAGHNGGVQRSANARVQLTQHESLYADASSSCSSYSWDDGRGNWDQMTTSYLGVSAGRQTDNSVGPYATAGWYDNNETAPWGQNHFCGSNVYVSGPAVFLGCWPDGNPPPMLPVLP